MKKSALFLSIASLLLAACAGKPGNQCDEQNPACSPKKSVPLAAVVGSETDHVASGATWAIAAQGRETAAAGEKMFAEGGNIIDAAVAVSFAISVERPQSTGIGGGGFLLFREGKTGMVYAVDFRERAPLKATRDMFLDGKGEFVPERSLNGILSVATPGLVAGLVEIHKKWGQLPLAKVLAPAIEVAEKGFAIPAPLAGALKFRAGILAKDPAAAKIFLHADGTPFQEGEILVQKDLGRTLRRIAEKGRAGYYAGAVRDGILRTEKRLHGLLTAKDLDSYKVKWRAPVHGLWRGLDLYSMPPPSSGGIHVLEILNTLENDPLRDLGALSAQAIHRSASAMQLAYADRAVYPGDPDFVTVPTDWLISKPYALSRRSLIDENHAKASSEVRAGYVPRAESPETTHFSIMDAAGNAVASTQTINFAFGSGVVAEGTGVLLNDEMDDFSAKPGASNAYGALGGDANAIAPGKTPLSSMSPTIVVDNGRPLLTVGAPGGTRIITCVAQTILNRVAYGLSPYDSVASVRFHHQWMPDRLDIEAPGPGESVVKRLAELGWNVNVKNDAIPCRVELVVRENETLTAVSDPRDSGKSLAR
jgi:gamma-glutamyltranspeptidase/glutathione hydrolase